MKSAAVWVLLGAGGLGEAAPPAALPPPTTLTIRAAPNLMKFDTLRFDVEAGSRVELTFKNPCVMAHNFVLLEPAAEKRLIEAVNAMGADGEAKNYVPEVAGILTASALLAPGASQLLKFKAPEKPGEYLYLCTFPGHWFTMRGVMRVVAKGAKLAAPLREKEKKDGVGDALQDAGISHEPLGTMERPLVMRTFVPDPGLDAEVFAHHGLAKPAYRYDPATRQDKFDEKPDAVTGKMVRSPPSVAARAGIPGAIAVNHGAEFSYVWDTTECRLLYAWRGGFLDMNPYWGKEPGGKREGSYIPKITGEIVYAASGPDPLAQPGEGAPQFGGYRMVNHAPEFWFRLGQRVIRQRVVPGAANGFALEVRVDDPAAPLQWNIAAGERDSVQASHATGGHLTVKIRDREPAPASAASPRP